MLLSEIKSADHTDLVILKKEHGGANSYWNGINWMGSRQNAVPVKSSEIRALEVKWRTRAKQIPVSRTDEEALKTTTVQDLWSENKDLVSWYRSATEYLVRPIEGTTPTQYEAFVVNGDQRKLYGKFTVSELKSVLVPIRPGQKPDAEGFTTYMEADRVEAFKYMGDPIKLVLDDTTARRLNHGDYVVRSNDGNEFVYVIEPATEFESTLKKA